MKFNKPILYKLLILVFTIIIIFLSLEVFCKKVESNFYFTKSVYLQKAKPFLHRTSKVKGLSYELIPYAKSEDNFFLINSKGIRDKEYDIPKPEDVYRIIVLGDSVTFATEYKIEYAYPKIIEKILNQKSKGNIRFEVLNAGVCAYNAFQKITFLEKRLLDYDPDLVIFQYLDDDYYRNAVVMASQDSENMQINVSLSEYFVVNFPKIFFLPYKIDRLLMSKFSSYRVLNKITYDFLSLFNRKNFPENAYRYSGSIDLDESMTLNKKAFANLNKLSMESNFEVLLLLVPELKKNSKIDDWIKNKCPNKYGFHSLDLKDQLEQRTINIEDFRIYPQGMCHFNKNGHKITAEIISDYLTEHLIIN